MAVDLRVVPEMNIDNALHYASTYFGERLAAPPGTTDAMVLWAAGTYCCNRFRQYPRIGFIAPAKGSGKSTALDLLEMIVQGPDRAADLTGPNIYRLITDAKKKNMGLTLLLDEGEHYISQTGMMTVLNSGWSQQGAFVRRLQANPKTGNQELKRFDTWAPAAYAMNGVPPDTLSDRSIMVHLSRAKPAHYMDDVDQLRADLAPVRAAFNAWTPELINAEGPDWLHNRDRQRWLAIFSIAATISGRWPDLADRACGLLEGRRPDDANFPVLLLTLSRDVFNLSGSRFISPSRLRHELCSLFPDKIDPKLTVNRLSRELKTFNGLGARSARPRDDGERHWCRDPDKRYGENKPDVVRAFHRADFTEFWASYDT